MLEVVFSLFLYDSRNRCSHIIVYNSSDFIQIAERPNARLNYAFDFTKDASADYKFSPSPRTQCHLIG